MHGMHGSPNPRQFHGISACNVPQLLLLEAPSIKEIAVQSTAAAPIGVPNQHCNAMHAGMGKQGGERRSALIEPQCTTYDWGYQPRNL